MPVPSEINESIKPPTLLNSLRIRQFVKAVWKVPSLTGVGSTETSWLLSAAPASKVFSVALLENNGIASCAGNVGENDDNDDTPAGLVFQTACRYHSKTRDTMEA